MITIYFERGIHARIVAKFETDEMYMQCLPALKKQAKREGMKITESDEGGKL